MTFDPKNKDEVIEAKEDFFPEEVELLDEDFDDYDDVFLSDPDEDEVEID